MNKDGLTHWLQTETYTYGGCYEAYYRTLPGEIDALGRLVCDQVIHPTVLMFPNPALEPYFGSFKTFPWDRTKSEDEIFVTAAAMTAELFRRDPRGFVSGKTPEMRLAVTCRHAAVLLAAIGKAKGIPTRCRSGFIDFSHQGGTLGDHWINQIWDGNRWRSVDASGYYAYENRFGFSQFDLPRERFCFAADGWIALRRGEMEESKIRYMDAKGTCGLDAALIGLMYDLHALMNHEVFYTFRPIALKKGAQDLSGKMLDRLDRLANVMSDPDENFTELMNIWENEREFRLLTSPFNEDF